MNATMRIPWIVKTYATFKTMTFTPPNARGENPREPYASLGTVSRLLNIEDDYERRAEIDRLDAAGEITWK